MPHASRRHTALAGVVATSMLLVLAPTGPAGAVWGTTGCYPVDTVPPIVSTVTLSPTAVDARTGAKKVHVVATSTDSSPRNKGISGVASIFVQLLDPTSVAGVNTASAMLKLTAGTSVDGTWAGDVTIVPWVAGGDADWYLSQVTTTDVAGNANTYATNPEYTGPTAPDDIVKTNWTKTVHVLSTPDITAPRLTDFTFTPSSVDTTSGTAKVTIKAHAVDAAAGVKSIDVGFRHLTPFRFAGASLKLVRGTRNSGTWKATAVVHQWVGNGTWQASVGITDRISNSREYTAAELKAKGWKHNLSVTSLSESRPPRLLDLAYTPHTIDVRSGPQSVTITRLEARDKVSGVAYPVVQFEGPGGYDVESALRRVDGTARHGTWAGKVRFPHCGPPPGTYRASVYLRDRAGNDRTYGSQRLHDLGLPSTLTVRARTLDTTPPAVTGYSGGNTTGPVYISFTEDVTGVTTESLQLYDDAFDPVPMSSIVCRDATAVIVDCETGHVRSASLNPTSMLTQYTYWVFTNQGGVDVQVRDLVGNPAQWEYAQGIASISSS